MSLTAILMLGIGLRGCGAGAPGCGRSLGPDENLGKDLKMEIFSFIIPIAIGAVAIVLLIGLWTMMRGGDPNTSQKMMRWRVILQFVAVAIMMGALWLSSK